MLRSQGNLIIIARYAWRPVGRGHFVREPNKSLQRTQAAFVTRLAMCEELQASRAPTAGAAELYR